MRKKKQSGPKIITLDIETAPFESYTWGLWEQNVGLEMIKLETSILSFSYKRLDEKQVHFVHAGGRGAAKVRDDLDLLKKLWAVLDEADLVVTQNGKAFDIKRINARLVVAGFKPYSPIKVIDTKLMAKKHFAFSSNRLAWLSEHLSTITKLKHKKFPGFELWAECLKDNKAAWREMEVYNKVDVLATEQVYLKLRGWTEGHPNVAAYSEMEDLACPKCGSKKVQKRGEAFTQSGRYHRFQCQDCGGWSRSRYTMNSVGKRKSLLAN